MTAQAWQRYGPPLAGVTTLAAMLLLVELLIRFGLINRFIVPLPSEIAADPRWEAANLPESTVREEYRHSGQWRQDAPAALAAR